MQFLLEFLASIKLDHRFFDSSFTSKTLEAQYAEIVSLRPGILDNLPDNMSGCQGKRRKRRTTITKHILSQGEVERRRLAKLEERISRLRSQRSKLIKNLEKIEV